MSHLEFNILKFELPLKRKFQWRVLLILVALYIIGNLAGIPLLLRTNAPIEPVWFWALATFIATLFISASMAMAGQVGLGAPLLEGRLPGSRALAWVRTGFALCGLMLALGFPLSLIASLGVDPATYPFGWELLGASIKAGVVEELLYRFFLVSLFVWLAGFLKHSSDGRPIRSVYWAAIILAGLLFGWAHVDARLSNPSGSLSDYALIMILNSSLGIYFGWLLLVLGLEWAMIAHFAYDAFLSMVVVPVHLLKSPIAWTVLLAGLLGTLVVSLRYLTRSQE